MRFLSDFCECCSSILLLKGDFYWGFSAVIIRKMKKVFSKPFTNGIVSHSYENLLTWKYYSLIISIVEQRGWHSFLFEINYHGNREDGWIVHIKQRFSNIPMTSNKPRNQHLNVWNEGRSRARKTINLNCDVSKWVSLCNWYDNSVCLAFDPLLNTECSGNNKQYSNCNI